jgi:mono/diheme cytochrome c family protein
MGRSVLLCVGILLLPVAAQGQEGAAKESGEKQIYEGWRQYSVHCARCHGQDVLGNPVTANLLESVAPGGATADRTAFTEVVLKGRTDRGMPGFEKDLEPAQVDAIYAYVRGRAEKKIPPGRPKNPAG